jgi:FkbM family methyltransferase
MNLFKWKKSDLQWTKRVKKTSRDKSSDHIPKVDNAGEVKLWNGASVQIMHNGVRVLAGGYHGEGMKQIISNLRGHHEPQEEKVFYEILKRVPDDAIMIEVGCFWAYYSLWFSHEMPNRKNYLIEPVPWKACLGRLNFALNNKNATIDEYFIKDENIGLAASAGVDEMTISGIKSIGLDDYVREKDIKHVQILHADIQGAEFELLKGANHMLSKQLIDYVFLSTHKGRHAGCKKLLEEYDYKILNEHTVKNGSGYDGLILAASQLAASKEPFQL